MNLDIPFIFGEPRYLYLLLLVPVIPVLYAVWEGFRRRRMRALGEESLLKELMPSYSPSAGWFRVIVFSLALGVFALGLARPRTGSRYAEREMEGSQIVIALDVSNSMLAGDYKPSRLESAKRAIRMLTARLARDGRSDRIGLVVFAGDAFVQLPVTADYASAEMFLDGISTSSVTAQGTDIAKALALSSGCLSDGSEEAGKAIVLISDGESHEADPVPIARDIHGNGIDIYTIGVGSTSGQPIEIDGKQLRDDDGSIVTTRLDEKTLMGIAEAGGGLYLHASDREFGLDRIVDALRELQTSRYSALVFEDYNEYYMYFYWAALALLVLELLPGERRSRWSLFDR